MKTLGGAVLVALLWCGCGSTPSTDAGIDAGGSTGGGAATGGGGGGGGQATGGGEGVDAGPVDAGPQEVLLFMVMDGPNQTPLAQAGVRVEGDGFAVDGATDAEGEVTISIPANKRPITVTAAKRDYGAFSVVGITTEVPQMIRLDALINGNLVVPRTIPVTISGRSDAGTAVILDSFDFQTTRFTTDSTMATYEFTSPEPFPLVAMEVDATPAIINWVATGDLLRDAGPQDLAFPQPAAITTQTAWSATLGTGTVGTSTTLASNAVGWKIAPAPRDETSWVVTGVSDAVKTNATIDGTLSAITGPYAPNRMVLELVDASQAWLLRYRVREVSAPFTFTIPDFTELAVSGTKLGDLGGHAVANAAFDTFCITVEKEVIPLQVVWRVCTAPGAPFDIATLPTLPGGSFPSGLNIAAPTTQLAAQPLLIDFEDATQRVWTTVNTSGVADAYRVTAGGAYLGLTGAWR